jgi:hypothetical protein
VQKYGVNVTPINAYSSIPSLDEIAASYEYTAPNPPYLDEGLFDRDRLRRGLADLMEYSAEFAPPLEGDEHHGQRFFWRNSQFSYSDAMSYYCFIRKLKPRTVVEVGGGFSTLLTLEALRRNGRGKVVCVEPFPRPFLANNTEIELHLRTAQEISPAWLNDRLQDGDVVSIDSTHTVKTGSDCVHIYLRLLPRIERSIYVHAHDIFLPFGVPQPWLLDLQIFWTEQYLVLALLTDNARATVLYGSSYHASFNRDALERLMGGKQAGGSSLWFEYRGAR